MVLIATNHRAVNYQELAEWAYCVVDTRNAMASIPPCKGKDLESVIGRGCLGEKRI